MNLRITAIVLAIMFYFPNCVKSQFAFGIDTTVLNTLQNQWLKQYYNKIENDLNKDSTLFFDKYGNYSTEKVMYYLSGIILHEQINIFSEFAKNVLTSSEYKQYKKLIISVSPSSKIPVLTLNKNIEFDNNWILSFTTQSLLKQCMEFNNYEYMYYLESSKIENDIFPSYIMKLFTTDNVFNYLGSLMSQAFLNFFIIMHEFYHSYYDKNPTSTIIRELKADSFAISKCLNYFDVDEKINESELLKLLESAYGKEKIEIILNSKDECSKYKKLIGDNNITAGEFFISQLGKAFIDVFNYRDINLILTNPEVIEIDLARTYQFNKISKKLLHCNVDSLNIFCCLSAKEIVQMEDIKNIISQFKNPEYYRKLKIDKNTFKSISPQNPSFISYQLGCYYLNLQDYKNAINYFSSANLFDEPTTTSILCNLICSDLYRYVETEKNSVKAKYYYEKAKEQNIIYPILQDKIINRSMAD